MPADGPTVLLLHGWPQTGHAWRRILPTLAASGYLPLAPDMRGCGDSDKPTGGYDAVSRMEDARALVAALGLGDEPIFVAGHGDEGAEAALAYAAQHPAEVAGIAAVSAIPQIRGGAQGWHGGFHQIPDLPETLIGPNLEAYLRHFFRAWSHDPDMLPEADLAVYVRALSAPGALRASLAPFRVPTPATALVVSPIPLLLLLGESDPSLDMQAAKDFVGSYGGAARLELVARGGHWLPEERPDPVAAALLTFFRAQTRIV